MLPATLPREKLLSVGNMAAGMTRSAVTAEQNYASHNVQTHAAGIG